MSIVKQLVELMGGEISVNSVYMNGSTFLVTLEQDIISERELGTFTLTSRMKVHEGEQYRHSSLPALAVRAITGTSWHNPPGWECSAWRHSIPSISGIR